MPTHDDTVITRPRVDTRTKLAPPSMWKVIFHNDDFTPMDFVTYVLQEYYGKSFDEAAHLMLTIHHKGAAQVALYPRDVAETKVMETMSAAQAHGHPLRATAEPA